MANARRAFAPSAAAGAGIALAAAVAAAGAGVRGAVSAQACGAAFAVSFAPASGVVHPGGVRATTRRTHVPARPASGTAALFAYRCPSAPSTMSGRESFMT